MTYRAEDIPTQAPKWNKGLNCVLRQLTPRERQIFDLIGRGKTTKEIAAILEVSAGTIGNHRKSICRKLDIHSTAELASHAALLNT